MIWAIDQDNQNHDALSGLLGDFTSSQLEGGGENKPLPRKAASHRKIYLMSFYITLPSETDFGLYLRS